MIVTEWDRDEPAFMPVAATARFSDAALQRAKQQPNVALKTGLDDLVHVPEPYCCGTYLHQFGQFIRRRDVLLGDAVDVDAAARLQIFPNGQVGVLGVQQVLYTFQVDLHERGLHGKLQMFRGLGTTFKNCVDAPRDDAGLGGVDKLAVGPGHGVGLATGGLAIGKDRAVVALEHRVDDRGPDKFKHLGLRGCRRKDTIERPFL